MTRATLRSEAARRSVGAPSCAARDRRCRPRRWRRCSLATSMPPRPARVSRRTLTQQAQTRRASGRLCRHRREGEARGDLGARQGRRRPAHDELRRRTRRSRPARRWSASSAASARRTARTASDRQRGPRGRNFAMGQGSGFFISADGYAVTNNHVVDKADDGRGHDRRRQDLHRQGDRHRSAHRSRADQGRRPQRLPVRQARRASRRASATGCSRSAIRSASAAR